MRSLDELLRLNDRAALVTGRRSHIGAAICETLAELGAAIVVVDKDGDACTAVARRISETYGVVAVPDVRDLGREDEVRMRGRGPEQTSSVASTSW